MKYLLVDGGHLAGRCGAINTGLYTSEGVPTSVTHAFLRGISYVRNLLKVDYKQLVICWDGGRSEFRMALYPGYKAGRVSEDSTPEDLKRREEFYQQVNDIRTLLSFLGCRQIWVKGTEADDVIGIVSKFLEDNPINEIIIYSGDYDMHQLVSDRVLILGPKDTVPKTKKQILFKWNVETVEEILLTKAIIGDGSDAITGIFGIGTKKCEQVLPYVKLVDGKVVFDSFLPNEKIRKIFDKVRAGSDIIERNLKLMRIPRTIEEAPYSSDQKEEILKQFIESGNSSDRSKFINMLRMLQLQSILDMLHVW